ncbi:MAG: DUF5518 domain-containing protein [Halanaeroarchaeum sp.]
MIRVRRGVLERTQPAHDELARGARRIRGGDPSGRSGGRCPGNRPRGGGAFPGIVAGYVAGGSLGSGAWHGLPAGALGGIVVTAFLAVAVAVAGSPGAREL